METKYCAGCEEALPLAAFARRGTGLQYRCKRCNSAYAKSYLPGQREVAAERSKQWRLNNLEQSRSSSRLREAHRDKRSPEEDAARKAKRRTRKTEAGGSFTAREWEALKAHYGNICLCCGISGEEVTLAADHIVPVARGGTSDISNIQPLCGSCNSRKGTAERDYRF